MSHRNGVTCSGYGDMEGDTSDSSSCCDDECDICGDIFSRTRLLTGSSALLVKDGHVESVIGAQTTFSSFVRRVNC